MKTLVIGASANPERYSYKAVVMLNEYGHEVIPLGIREGKIKNMNIIKDKPDVSDIDTVTMYVAQKHQVEFYDYILEKIKPRRIIFNPGTENFEFQKMAKEKNIMVQAACTLVLLSSGQY